MLLSMLLAVAAPPPKLEARVVALEARQQSEGGRPATAALEARQFREQLASGYDAYDGKPPRPYTRAEIQDEWTNRAKRLEKSLAWDAGVSRTTPGDDVSTRCLASVMQGCFVESAGWTNGGTLEGDADLRILWQIQSGSTETDGIGAGILLWDASGGQAPRLIGWSFEGVRYDAPKLEWQEGVALLWVPGIRAGTAATNADLLYVRRDGRWVEIETGSWREELAKRLPPGLGVWKGVDYDLTSLGGWSQLWRDRDGNCCPTGGVAFFDYAIEGTALVLKDVNVTRTEDMVK